MIVYKALKTIQRMSLSHRYSIGLTIFSMAFSAAIMLRNGQASQRMDPPLFLSLQALFNMYIFALSYMYSPCVQSGDSGEPYELPASEKERRQIMNAFYESELNETGPDTSRNFDEESTLNKRDSIAKDKLWQNIVNQAKDDENDSSSDDDQV